MKSSKGATLHPKVKGERNSVSHCEGVATFRGFRATCRGSKGEVVPESFGGEDAQKTPSAIPWQRESRCRKGRLIDIENARCWGDFRRCLLLWRWSSPFASREGRSDCIHSLTELRAGWTLNGGLRATRKKGMTHSGRLRGPDSSTE